MLTAIQKANRLRGVGCSEVLAALGKDSRCSRLELYGRKLGELPEPDLGSDPRVLFGNLLEPVLRDEFARRHQVRVVVGHQTLHHRDAPLLGHPDGWVPAWHSGVEIKTADRFEADEFGEPGTDQVPVRYFIQCAAYIALTGADHWHLAVLIGGNDFRVYRIERDTSIEDMILDGVRAFWKHVETLVPPDPATPEDVRIRWPKDFGTTIEATEQIEHSVARLREMRAELRQMEAQCEAETVAVQTYMQEAAQLVDRNGNTLVTWRTAKPSLKLDLKALQAEYSVMCAHFMREVPGSRRFLLKGV